MAQNIYDDPEFFARYGELPRSVQGLAGAPEWPAMCALLPDLGGLRIVDLGCGFGWFCRYAAGQGAAHVLGLDVSENMLARARSMTATGSIVYERADLETVDLPEAAFDLAYSSLALHYVEDLGRLLATVHRALRPGARLVASMEHPIFTAPRKPEWVVERQGCRSWPLDSYFMEGERRTDWLTKGVIKQHRTLGTLLSQFTRNGFRLAHVADWRPADEQIAHDPQLAKELERPMFLLLAADR